MSDLLGARRSYESAVRSVKAHSTALQEAKTNEREAFLEYAKLKWGLVIGETIVESKGVRYLASGIRLINGVDRPPHIRGRKLKKDGSPGVVSAAIWGEWRVTTPAAPVTETAASQ